MIVPIYEQKRDFANLSRAYFSLYEAYKNVVDAMDTGRRLLGNYYKVAFYGEVILSPSVYFLSALSLSFSFQALFESEHKKEYVYKEPKVTSLVDICERLETMYSSKFGKGKVKLIMDSNPVNVASLDASLAYIQLTHVKPYFEAKELEERLTDFERNNNIKRFVFETPFTRTGKAHGEVHEQWKRKTIVTSK